METSEAYLGLSALFAEDSMSLHRSGGSSMSLNAPVSLCDEGENLSSHSAMFLLGESVELCRSVLHKEQHAH